MSFFKPKQNTEETSVTSDILSQVRIMGEKSSSPLSQGSGPGSVSQRNEAPAEQNPVSNPFIHNENSPSSSAEAPTNPFVSEVPSTSEIPVIETAAALPSSQTPETSFLKKDDSMDNPKHSSKVIIIGAILMVALVLIIGVFFYLEKVKDAELSAQVESEKNNIQEPVVETPAPVLEKSSFSTERSNYLSLDTETATKDSIMAQIKENGRKMEEALVKEPISFQITDENNIPLAFNRFVFLADLKVPENLLALLDEDFNMVLYSDGGQMRIGLALKFKEDLAENPMTILTQLEPGLPQSFAALLYPGDVNVPATAIFGTGAYNSATVRYTNVAPEKMYSFDYILQDKLFYIGNSKEVTRKTFEVGIR